MQFVGVKEKILFPGFGCLNEDPLNCKKCFGVFLPQLPKSFHIFMALFHLFFNGVCFIR